MSSAPEERIPEDDETTEAPLTMAASVVLTNLPRDASKALETAGNLTVQKSKCSLSDLFCRAYALVIIIYLAFCTDSTERYLSVPLVNMSTVHTVNTQ